MRKIPVKLTAFLLSILTLLSFFPAASLAYGNTASFQTVLSGDYFEYRENGTWHTLSLPFYTLQNASEVNPYAYALAQDGTDPNGETYTAEALSASMSEAVKNGVDLILDHGYPSVYPSDLTASEAFAATQAALLFWLAEKGVSGISPYMNRRTSSDLLRAKSGHENILAMADELLSIARAGVQPVRSVTPSVNRLVLGKLQDGSYAGSFDLDIDQIDTYWLSASGMPSTVTLSGSTSVSDCTITLSAPANLSGTEFDLVITGYAAGDASNYTVYRPENASGKTLLYNEAKAVPVCESTVHVVIPGAGRIRIYETSEEGAAIPYSVWGVYRDEACSERLLTATQTTNGFTNTGYLDSGITYYVRQVSTVEPYLIDNTVYPVEVRSDETVSLRVTAKKASGTITFSAKGDVIASLSGTASDYGTVYTPVTGHGGTAEAVFTVTDGNGGTTEVRTDESGTAVLSGLPFGTYTVTQTAAPVGVSYDPEPKTVTIAYAGGDVPEVTAEITSENNVLTGTVRMKKMTETYDRENRVFNPISGSGFVFGVFAAEQIGIFPKDALLEILTTGTDGGAESASPLPYGSYYFRELSVPDEKIHMSHESFPFTLDSETNTSYLDAPFENDMHKCYVSVSLTDAETGEPVEGAGFKVLGKDDGYVYDTFRTDATGYGSSCALPVGDYILVQDTAAPGYTLDGEQTEFSITTDTKSAIVFEKTSDSIRVILVKTAAGTGERLAGALISVYRENGDLFHAGRTDENGLLTLDRIPIGHYTFKETEPPYGYALNSSEFSFTVAEDGTVTGDTTLTDEITALTVTKRDAYKNAPMGGIAFTLTDPEGRTVFTRQTDGGYRIPCAEADGTSSFLTDANGTAQIRGLTVGSYTLTETVPYGYVSNAPVTFTLSPSHSVSDPLKLDVVNTPTALLVKKTDAATGNPLSGAGFKIKVKSGAAAFRVLSFAKQTDGSYFCSDSGTETLLMVSGTGELKLIGLPLGELWIEEAVTPEGYFPISAQKVVITDSMTTASPFSLTIKNSKYVKLGMDSDWWEFPALCLGILIAAGGTVFFFIRRKKKKGISVPFPR
ncbi:MAG: Cys-Gln thioester bond-forming surface protein [Clostridia bacterium]|nr:Cys-Gln thioester bond-forming surface protein [Clostridia bacterium]